MGYRIERIDGDLFAEGVGGFGKFLLLLQREAEVIVNMLVVGIGGDLCLERGGGIVEWSEAQVGEAEIVPALFAFGINLDGVLQQGNGFPNISGIERGDAGFEEFVGADSGGNGGGAGGGLLDDELLGFVGFDSAGKGEVITDARGGEFAHFEIQEIGR